MTAAQVEPVVMAALAALAVTDPDAPGIFDLGRAVGGDDRCVYVRTHLWSDRRRTVRLEFGSDDGIKAWLNGAVVLAELGEHAEAASWYRRALTLTAAAGHAGLPVLSIPVAEIDSCPIGLSLLGEIGRAHV